MKTKSIVLSLIAIAILAMACATAPPPAPMSASGSPYEIKIMVNKGNPAEEHQKSNDEIAAWMEQDLVNQLNRSGYKAELIKSENDYKAKEGQYLLLVNMVKYNPGSSAARFVVGFGAGAASLDNHYELFGSTSTPVMKWDDGAGTSGHWSAIPRKLNANAVKKITAKLAE